MTPPRRWQLIGRDRWAHLRRPVLWSGVLPALALAVIVLLLVLPPHNPLDKADRAAFAVCHRIPERTLTIAGRPLPLCARCSGSYLGALLALGILGLRGRLQAGALPPRRYRILLGFCIALWAIDGFNSYLTLFAGAPHLYEPRNALRLATGILQGIALTVILLPLVNRSLSLRTAPSSALDGPGDLLWLAAAGALLFLLLNTDQPVLLVPLAIISGLAVLGLATLLNLLILTGVFERTGSAPVRPQPLLICVALAATELAVIAMARTALEARLGPPF